MKTSETIADLAAAFAKAQGSIHGAIKDSTNPHFKSQYADLASVWDACRKPLTDNGLSIAQGVECQGNRVTVTTRMMHVSGQWLESAISSDARDAGPQSVGSVVTYLRRYSLSAMVGVAPEDDDGNDGQPAPRQHHESNGHTNGHGKPQPTEQWKHFRADCDTLIREHPSVYQDWNAVVEHGQFVLRGRNIDPALFPDWFMTRADGDKLRKMMDALEDRTRTAPAALVETNGEIPF